MKIDSVSGRDVAPNVSDKGMILMTHLLHRILFTYNTNLYRDINSYLKYEAACYLLQLN